MGNCCKDELPIEEKKLLSRDKKIEQRIQEEKKKQFEEVKILLLGAGESGKSTFFKQMRILQDGKIPQKELDSFKPYIFQNCISQMKTLIIAAENLGIPIQNIEIVEKFHQIRSNDTFLNQELSQSIHFLWNDPGIQKAYESRDIHFQLNDSASYFFDNILRIGDPNYVVNQKDALMCRIQTNQIEQCKFTVNSLTFLLIDVGGQRTARRKWIHSFQNVTSIIFCASLSGFNQVLREDTTVNRLKESISLFHEICTSPWFMNSSIILFLNKKDIFKSKIEKYDLSQVFKEYKGTPNSYKEGFDFIRDQFKKASEINSKQARKLYIFKTCAVNSKNVQKVFRSIADTLMRQAVKNLNLV
ncbi:guanine nucleotide-binding protein g(o) subunit alpha [Anaeramoeba ignava]|uniref:Guanine nucleotide-binding protein g(O) subunit alpha n=1 Tax=Anaeramoeba ignava TaxID=1746090 RepID=A0A9Q0LHG4_ANAIG|nr:guanine nucleotide-binding protein g(o) subunit alpha [Anaeramoeba ignava]